SATLAFVITGTRSDWIDITPVIFRLWMDCWITVDFAGGSLKDAAFKPLCKTKHVNRTVHRGFCRLHRIMLIMDRRRRAGQIVNFVRLDIQRERHVVAYEFKTRVRMKSFDISFGSRK